MAASRSTYADLVVEGPASAGQTAIGNPVVMGIVDSSNNIQPVRMNASGGFAITSTAAATGGYTYANLAANGTTTVKSGVGTLHAITINTKGASANTATVYDNTVASGMKIATIDTTDGVGTITYDVAFGTGLTIVLATGTAADITVAYK